MSNILFKSTMSIYQQTEQRDRWLKDTRSNTLARHLHWDDTIRVGHLRRAASTAQLIWSEEGP